jgi:D-glycero-alpha-D-manno-heptose-7-phosphate kinase
MLIICRSPVRISLFGGGTDYPGYYLRHPGAVLGATIDKYTHVSISTPGNYFDYKIRISYSRTELVRNLSEIEHPNIRECLRFKNFDQNLDIHIFSDLPAKTGLGSSSSFTVGFLHAIYALKGEKIPKQRLAEEACYIEQKLIEENVGSQDQFHAAFGGINVIEFSDKEIRLRPAILSKASIDLLEDHLLLFYTGLTRHASGILKEQIEKTKAKSNDGYLKRMYEMVFEAEELLSKPNSMPALGKLLDEGWQLKKQLSSKISNHKIDQAYVAAMKRGAYGGKLCGAGSGGFLAMLVPKERQKEVKEILHDLPAVPLKFEHSGSTIIYMKP